MLRIRPFRLICILPFLPLPLLGQPVDPYGESEEASPFFGNPFEPEERRQRDAEAAADGESENWSEAFQSRLFFDVFDTDLPGVGYDDAWHLRFNPSLSDVFGDDYIRWPIGVRYNFNTHLEGQFDLGIYTGNPLESGNGIGFYNIEPGFKYTIRSILNSPWNMAFGLRSRIPFAEPPLEITDGYARYLPYISVSRQLHSNPDVLGYLSFRYELVADTPFTTHPVVPQPKDRVFVMPGFIYYPGGRFRYGLELEYRTNSLSLSESPERPDNLTEPLTREEIMAFETTHELIALPSVTWFPTRETRRGIRIPGNWDVGVRLEIPIVEETGEDFGLSVRFRWYYDYQRFLSRDLPQFFRRGVDDEDN